MSKILVCYFSASGVTKNVALHVAKIIDGDLFEIEPVQIYTENDLNWNDAKSRSSIEMNDKTSRPAIKRKVENLSICDKVVLGFPVWWYTAPTIINTFLEENDFSNKRIYVFVTSGGSSHAGSLKNLKEMYPNLNFVDGKRLYGNESVQEIENWIQ